jgi:arylsulfatase A-like enzyme
VKNVNDSHSPEVACGCRFTAALVYPLLGAIFFGLADMLIGMALSQIQMSAGDRLALVSFGMTRHLVVGLALAVIMLAIVALPWRVGRVPLRLLLASALLGAFFVFFNESLTRGNDIAARSYAKYLLWGTRIGGPIAAFVGMAIVFALVDRAWSQRMRPAARFAWGLLAVVVAGGLALTHIRIYAGQYPDIHAQEVVFGLLFATAGAFFLLGPGGWDVTRGRKPLVVLGLAALLLAAGIWQSRRPTFQRVRGSVGMLVQGAEPHEWLIGRALRAFEPKLDLQVVAVDDLLRGLENVEQADLGPRLDQVLPHRKNFNVLLIAIDTLRFDRCGFNGYTKNPTTPALDALAKESFVFSRAYTAYPTSNYAYASLLTGLFPGSTPLHGVRTYQSWEFPDEIYYPKLFSKAGLHAIGSTAMGLKERANIRFFGMLDKGFDSFNPNQPPGDIHGDWITRTFGEQLDARPTARFFGFMHYMEPHDPYQRNPEWDFGSAEADRYDSDIAAADAQVAKVVAALKSRKLWDSTVVVVFSDHGEEFLEHGFQKHDSSLYQEQIHVPLVIRVPGLAGRAVDATVGTADILPTMTRLVGVADPVARQGKSLLPYMLGGDGLPERVAFAQKYFFEIGTYVREWRAIVYGGAKLIEKVKDPNSDFELYDLEKDPKERRNVFGQAAYAERQGTLLGLMRTTVKAVGERVGKTGNEDSPRQALQKEIAAALEKVQSDDPKAAIEGLKLICNKFLSRYDDMDPAARDLGPETHEMVRRVVLARADAAAPKTSYQIIKLLRLLAHPDNALYFRKLAAAEGAPAATRLEGLFGLAALREKEALEPLRAAAKDPALVERFEVAIALAELGEPALLDEFVAYLRSDSTWDTAPLLRTLTSVKSPAGLPILLDRASQNDIVDFTSKVYAVTYAAAVGGPLAERLCFLLAEETDPMISGPAREILARWLGSQEALESRRALIQVEREGAHALMNGKLVLAETVLGDYVTKNPAASPRAVMDLARTRLLQGDPAGARAAFERVAQAGDPEYAAAALRQRDNIERTRWFYGQDELACAWKLVSQPKAIRRNRAFTVEVELKNESNVYWHGGQWTYALTVRTALVDDEGRQLEKDARGVSIKRPETMNFLPLGGLAPGESVKLAVVGRAPTGNWEGKLLVWLEQRAGGKTAKQSLMIDTVYKAQ